MSSLREPLSLLALNVRSWRVRPVATGVAVVGFMIVVLVFAGIFSIERGYKATTNATGSPNVALVMLPGAHGEMESSIPETSEGIIATAPGIAEDNHHPLVAAEYLDIVNIPKRSNGAPTDVAVRGVAPTMFAIQPQIRIMAGRRFKPGLNEIIVGRRAAQEFKGLQLGDTVRWSRTPWKVVGIFSSDGDIHESEIWTGLHALQNADGGAGHVAAVYAKLVSPDAFGAFKATIEHDPRLHVVAYRESRFFAQQAAGLSRFITSVGALIALLMGAGAVVGAVNIMYSTISARAPEIATLRAIGFHPGPTFTAVLAEGMLLGLLGGAIGVCVAYVLFNGHRASTLNGYTQVVFHFSVSMPLLAASLGFALAMGLIGGVFPAIRAARLPVAVALRET